MPCGVSAASADRVPSSVTATTSDDAKRTLMVNLLVDQPVPLFTRTK
jgi:hypothetical protein